MCSVRCCNKNLVSHVFKSYYGQTNDSYFDISNCMYGGAGVWHMPDYYVCYCWYGILYCVSCCNILRYTRARGIGEYSKRKAFEHVLSVEPSCGDSYTELKVGFDYTMDKQQFGNSNPDPIQITECDCYCHECPQCNVPLCKRDDREFYCPKILCYAFSPVWCLLALLEFLCVACSGGSLGM